MQFFFKAILFFCLISPAIQGQNYPTFGSEIQVSITGLTFDAMEPYLSHNEQLLFFNSLNSGGNTNLYYAQRVNDSTFTFAGPAAGTFDSVLPHLDAVASIDSSGFFVWVSLRDYPATLENLLSGQWQNDTLINLKRVYGDFYIAQPGYLIMDAAINWQGNQLLFCNALFNNCSNGLPCTARLGIAALVNDSTFNKIPNSDSLLQNVNDSNYLVYAPQLSANGLELYYTRLQPSGLNTEICVAVRNNPNDPFSLPQVLVSYPGFVPEAPALSMDGQKLYYHKKNNAGVNRVFLRYRDLNTSLKQNNRNKIFGLIPNPAADLVRINFIGNKPTKYKVVITNSYGQVLSETIQSQVINLENLSSGVYFVSVVTEENISTQILIKP